MKRALVLFHSLFGNTKAVAESLAKGIKEGGVEVDCQSIDMVNITDIAQYDFVAIGSPTHMIRPSKEMKEFLKKLRSVDLSGLSGFCFDTRNESRMNKSSWLILENSAARSIEKALKRTKVRIIRPRVSAIVHGREGPLDTGVEESFLQIGIEIGQKMAV
jgi:menaquinone-dependent protoporphyrinogen IX oxidase